MRTTDDCHQHRQQLAPTPRAATARVEDLRFNDDPCALGACNVSRRSMRFGGSIRFFRGVFFRERDSFRDDVSGRHLFEPASDVPVASSSPFVRWFERRFDLAKIVSRTLHVKKSTARDPRRLPSIDLSFTRMCPFGHLRSPSRVSTVRVPSAAAARMLPRRTSFLGSRRR